jgi:hypothetical protein
MEVTTEGTTEKYTVQQAKDWLAAMGEKGIYGGASARIRATAIESLVSVLGSDEPNDVASVLADIDSITNRWATKNHANPETSQTYKTRAKTTLEAFLEFQRDPQSFKLRKRVEGNGGAKRAEKAAKARAKDDAGATPGPSAAPVAEPGTRSYPVSTGEFVYRIPADGLTQKDVFRIACHLVTLASDFDPVVSSGLFALARNDIKPNP